MKTQDSGARTVVRREYLPIKLARTDGFVATPHPPRVAPQKVGRNEPCPCGSLKKFKRCCLGARCCLAASAS